MVIVNKKLIIENIEELNILYMALLDYSITEGNMKKRLIALDMLKNCRQYAVKSNVTL